MRKYLLEWNDIVCDIFVTSNFALITLKCELNI